MRRLVAALPSGKTLPPEVWHRRHRAMTALVWLHALVLPLYGLTRGYPLWHVAIGASPIVAFAIGASVPYRSPRFRSCMVSLGLLSSSAVLVHLAGGATEAHFHFFVMVSVMACYEEWVPYGLAIAFVLFHHALMGIIAPQNIYEHPGAASEPWKWAGIHAGFITALCVVNVVSWRLNEDARARTQASEARFRGAFEDAPVGMALIEPSGRIVRVNRALAEMTGYPEERMLDMSVQEFRADNGPGTWMSDWDGSAREVCYRRADGTAGWTLWQRSLLSDDEGDIYLVQCVDISERKDAERRLEFQARYDLLTGLPNRDQFVRRLGDTIAGVGEREGHVAVCYIDLDNFKVINDSLGHAAGDRLLAIAGERLAQALRPGDVVGRFGGDEFTVLLRDVVDHDDALAIAERLVDVLRPPFVLDGEQRYLTASVGLTITGDPRTTPDDMLRDADTAMYRAKEQGRSQCAVFDDSLRERAIERLDLESGLRHALERDELRLLYQPEVSLTTGRIVAVEALLRWDHPKHGLVSPAKFIPIAEQSGLIVPIGAWVVREACRTAAEWRRSSATGDLTIAVNLSARQLGAVDLVDTVRGALADAGLPPSTLCLEVTETALMEDMSMALDALGRLKEIGVRLAVDDFGIGYSSLKHLKQLMPVDILKIDKSFVDGLVDKPEDRAIVEAVVGLAASLHVDAIAEGVESADQAEALRALSCGFAQGFHFARPSEASAVRQLLEAQAVKTSA